METPTPRARTLALRLAAVAAAYALAAKAGLLLAIPPGNVTVVFPASGVALAAALRWSWWGLGGVALGSFVVNALTPAASGAQRWLLSAGIALGAALQAWTAAWLVRRWASTERWGVRDVWRFVALGALVGSVVNASLSASLMEALGLLGSERYGYVWLTWWLGDATGVITAAPLLLLAPEPALAPRTAAEKALLAAATLLLGGLALWSPYPLFYLLLPPLLWGAYRFGLRGAAAVLVLLSILCVAAAVEQAGFTHIYRQELALLILQGFLSVAALSALSLGALVEGQARDRLSLRQVNEALDARVDARTRELAAANRLLTEQERQLRAYNEALDARLRASISERSEQLAATLARLVAAGPSVSAGPLPGSVFGRVRVGRRLGSGGMADVFEAHEIESGQRVALKVLRVAEDAERQQRLLQEARAAAAVVHPTIVRIVDMGVAPDGPLYLMLEFVDGETLLSRLARPPSLSPAVVCRLGSLAAEGLAAAHAAGVVHRDIKPANLMITAAGAGLKILDFGISKLASSDASITSPQHPVGTPPYMSPEQIREPTRTGPPTDLYSLGVVLFEALAGRRPFEAPTASGFLLAHLTESPADVRLLAPTVPAALASFLARLLAKNPAERPTAAEAALALSSLADELGAPTIQALAAQSRAAALADTASLPTLSSATLD